MGEELIQRLEDFFQLSPSPSGLIKPPDPEDQILRPASHIYGKPVRQAAVLIPIIASGPEPMIMLTRRTEHLRSHAGQISLPGGSRDPEGSDLIATALREAEEETRLPPEAVRIMGTLPALLMPSAFHVTPVVGLVRPDTPVTPCPNEVAEIFYAPASLILDPSQYRISSMEFQNRQRKFRELQFRHYRIWGATAAILHHLAEQLHASQ